MLSPALSQRLSSTPSISLEMELFTSFMETQTLVKIIWSSGKVTVTRGKPGPMSAEHSIHAL